MTEHEPQNISGTSQMLRSHDRGCASLFYTFQPCNCGYIAQTEGDDITPQMDRAALDALSAFDTRAGGDVSIVALWRTIYRAMRDCDPVFTARRAKRETHATVKESTP